MILDATPMATRSAIDGPGTWLFDVARMTLTGRAGRGGAWTHRGQQELVESGEVGCSLVRHPIVPSPGCRRPGDLPAVGLGSAKTFAKEGPRTLNQSRTVVPRRLSARLLGTFAVALDGRRLGALAWQHGSAERLLKLLLVSPRHQLRREVAAELLWPEAPPGRAMGNLRRALHFLARALEPNSPGAVLVHDHQLVGIASTVQLETDHHALESALDRLQCLLRAPQLADEWLLKVSSETERILAIDSCELLPDDPYETWLARHRDQLLQHWQSVMLPAAQALGEGSHLAQAHAVVDRSLAIDPADEDAHRLAIELYAREGRGHAARRQFLACQRILRDQYAADPSPQTVAALMSRSADPASEPELVPHALPAGALPGS